MPNVQPKTRNAIFAYTLDDMTLCAPCAKDAPGRFDVTANDCIACTDTKFADGNPIVCDNCCFDLTENDSIDDATQIADGIADPIDAQETAWRANYVHATGSRVCFFDKHDACDKTSATGPCLCECHSSSAVR